MYENLAFSRIKIIVSELSLRCTAKCNRPFALSNFNCDEFTFLSSDRKSTFYFLGACFIVNSATLLVKSAFKVILKYTKKSSSGPLSSNWSDIKISFKVMSLIFCLTMEIDILSSLKFVPSSTVPYCLWNQRLKLH